MNSMKCSPLSGSWLLNMVSWQNELSLVNNWKLEIKYAQNGS